MAIAWTLPVIVPFRGKELEFVKGTRMVVIKQLSLIRIIIGFVVTGGIDYL